MRSLITRFCAGAVLTLAFAAPGIAAAQTDTNAPGVPTTAASGVDGGLRPDNAGC